MARWRRGFSGSERAPRAGFGPSPKQTFLVSEMQVIMPMHHRTFRLSFEPFREPIERFQAALQREPDRIALREIGESIVLPT